MYNTTDIFIRNSNIISRQEIKLIDFGISDFLIVSHTFLNTDLKF